MKGGLQYPVQLYPPWTAEPDDNPQNYDPKETQARRRGGREPGGAAQSVEAMSGHSMPQVCAAGGECGESYKSWIHRKSFIFF